MVTTAVSSLVILIYTHPYGEWEKGYLCVTRDGNGLSARRIKPENITRLVAGYRHERRKDEIHVTLSDGERISFMGDLARYSTVVSEDAS